MVIISDLPKVQPCLLIRSQLLLQKTTKKESQPQIVTRIMQLPRRRKSFGVTEAHHLQERLYLHSCPAQESQVFSQPLSSFCKDLSGKIRVERLAAFSGLPDR